MLILSHIGSKLPSYTKYCLKQTRIFYKDDIFFVTDHPDKSLFKKYNVTHFRTNFNNEKFRYANKNIEFNKYPSRNFWLYSLSRLFFIEELVDKLKIKNFVIYENDILIYHDLIDIIEKLKNHYKIGITVNDDKRVTTGFSFFSSYNDLIDLNNDIMKIVGDKEKMENIKNHYSSEYPSEMVFIRKILKEKKYIAPLPTLPYGPQSIHSEKIGLLFDPAPYGQFLGGTPKEFKNKKSYVDESTYIGKELLKKRFSITIERNNGLKKPFLLFNNDKFEIANLHIHSKKLKKFTSKSFSLRYF